MNRTGRYGIEFKQADTGEWERHLVLNTDDNQTAHEFYFASRDASQRLTRQTILGVRLMDNQSGMALETWTR